MEATISSHNSVVNNRIARKVLKQLLILWFLDDIPNGKNHEENIRVAKDELQRQIDAVKNGQDAIVNEWNETLQWLTVSTGETLENLRQFVIELAEEVISDPDPLPYAALTDSTPSFDAKNTIVK